jgi:YfiH family protein
MEFVTLGERRYAQFGRLRHQAGLVHAFSTRPLNVAPRSGPDADQRRVNRHQMTREWGLDPAALRHCTQVHRTTLVHVRETTPAGALPECDGALTDRTGLPLMTFSADCPLVLLYDARRHVLGLVHASWRCTVSEIVTQLVTAMRDQYRCDPADLHAGVGPGAGPCCYEVREDVYAAAAHLPDRERLFPRRSGRMYFDLWQANAAQLAAAGVPHHQLEIARICTLCRNDVFYSFRREGPGVGHFGLLAALLPG